MNNHKFQSNYIVKEYSFISYLCARNQTYGFTKTVIAFEYYGELLNTIIKNNNCEICGFLFFPPNFIELVKTVYIIGGVDSVVTLFQEQIK